MTFIKWLHDQSRLYKHAFVIYTNAFVVILFCDDLSISSYLMPITRYDVEQLQIRTIRIPRLFTTNVSFFENLETIFTHDFFYVLLTFHLCPQYTHVSVMKFMLQIRIFLV